MEPDITPIAARGGVISGRVITVLLVSIAGALFALSCAWWLFAPA
jgi:hypothetical protein